MRLVGRRMQAIKARKSEMRRLKLSFIWDNQDGKGYILLDRLRGLEDARLARSLGNRFRVHSHRIDCHSPRPKVQCSDSHHRLKTVRESPGRAEPLPRAEHSHEKLRMVSNYRAFQVEDSQQPMRYCFPDHRLSPTVSKCNNHQRQRKHLALHLASLPK